MKKIKILFIESEKIMGGGQIGLVDILNHLDKNLFDPIVLVPHRSGSVYETFSKINKISLIVYNYNHLPDFVRKRAMLPIFMPFGVFLLKIIIRRIHPDIIHNNNILAAKYGASAANQLQIPNIVTIRNVYNDKILHLNRIVEKRVINNANYVICNSIQAALIFNSRHNKGCIRTILNGIKLENFSKKNNSLSAINILRSKLGILDKSKIFTTVGFFKTIKGHSVLIQAIPEVIKNYPECHFIFIGEESSGTNFKESLKNMAKRLGVLSHLTILPFQKDISKYYHLSFGTILPSINGEGLPRAIIESIASGVPPIGTRLAGIPDLIIDGKNGFLCNINDSNSLAMSIQKMLALSKKDYLDMQKSNKRLATEKYNIKTMIHKYVEIYNKLIME